MSQPVTRVSQNTQHDVPTSQVYMRVCDDRTSQPEPAVIATATTPAGRAMTTRMKSTGKTRKLRFDGALLGKEGGQLYTA
jgi:hypothetical protein